MDVDELAGMMFVACLRDGQAARFVPDDAAGEAVRDALRRRAREERVRIRTALMDDVVVVARTDASLWQDDAATMRQKLTPT